MNTKLFENWVIIPAYNGADLLEACVSSILASRGDWRVLIVDNNSTDETHANWAQNARVEYVKNETNVGFGRACNIGARLALKRGARTITFLNQDATVFPETLSMLAETLLQNPKCAIACPINFEQEDVVSSQFSRWLTSDNQQFMADALKNRLKTDYAVGFLNAACWMFSKSSLERVGGFDPIFFMYQEDKEMASRVAHYDFEIRVNPKAWIMHQRSLRAVRSSLKDRIQWSSVAPYANLIGATRNYRRNFWRSLPGALLNWFKAVFASVLAADFVAVSGQCIGLWQFAFNTKTNHSHFQKIKRRESGLFLN